MANLSKDEKIVYGLRCKFTGIEFTGSVITWLKDNGTAYSDADVDRVLIFKTIWGYVKRNFDGPVSVTWFGAKGNGKADDYLPIQKAINTGQHVYFPFGNYKSSNSFYANTHGQNFYGQATITMDSSLGKPAIFLGAKDSNGTPSDTPILNGKIGNGIKFQGIGVKVVGSVGYSFVKATTWTLDTPYAWGFHAGMDVRGPSLANTILNPDFRYNVHGVYDPSTDITVSDLQGTQFFGGRIEANSEEGCVLGSPNLKFFGTIIEGNNHAAVGGDGTKPEVRITGGLSSGSITFNSCYMESSSTKSVDCMILVENGSRHVHIIGGEYYANGTTNKYIVKSLSNSTVQSVSISDAKIYYFKNFVKGTFKNNSFVSISNVATDVYRDASVDVTLESGATLNQIDRVGFKTSSNIRGNNITATGNITAVAGTFSGDVNAPNVKSPNIASSDKLSVGIADELAVLDAGGAPFFPKSKHMVSAGVAGWLVGVADGNNYRMAPFVDAVNKAYGLTFSRSGANIPFVILQAGLGPILKNDHNNLSATTNGVEKVVNFKTQYTEITGNINIAVSNVDEFFNCLTTVALNCELQVGQNIAFGTKKTFRNRGSFPFRLRMVPAVSVDGVSGDIFLNPGDEMSIIYKGVNVWQTEHKLLKAAAPTAATPPATGATVDQVSAYVVDIYSKFKAAGYIQ